MSMAVEQGPDVPRCVVCIGASAGGLEALEAFFDHLPSDSGAAFVVVQHLSPDFESRMDELLGRHTHMKVRQLQENTALEPNTLYLSPANKEMIVSGGKLITKDRDTASGFSLPIDNFLRSLAQDAGRRAVAIILSGSGSDGTRGAREIQSAGGLVMAQEPSTARFDSMPKSVITSGVVTTVASPDALPRALMRHLSGDTSVEVDLASEASNGSPYGRILTSLREACGIDFAHYKPTTVTRRIERRLQLKGQNLTLEAYAERLGQDSAELNALYHDLLIGVTRFFRDSESFDALKRVALARQFTRDSNEEMRIWVAGCATGEEAYSLALLLAEFNEQLAGRRPIKLFATDVHGQSLEYASAGRYPVEALESISQGNLERYFVRDDAEHYTVGKLLRQMVVFAKHNVLEDAPFTRMDLITCRNLLIYLKPEAQRKVLSLFHFGLRANGVLFLGPSETPGVLGEEFDALDPRWKIYRKRRDVRLPVTPNLALSASPSMAGARRLGLPAPRLPDSRLMHVYDSLLQQHLPPSLLVGSDYELLHSFGGAESILRIPSGRASNNLLDLVRPELKTALASALQHAERDNKRVVYTGIVPGSGDTNRYTLSVLPFGETGEVDRAFVVTLDEAEETVDPTGSVEIDMDSDRASLEYIDALEKDLRLTRENLQATIEELQASNEELQATNEELVASNEELQSTNEELHSVNEELYTVNSEHQRQIETLTLLTNDMDNLLQSLEVGVLFLDSELRVRKFTDSMAHVFNLLPQDVGREFNHFSHNINYPELLTSTEEVLSTGRAVEIEVTSRSGDFYLLRILPYQAKGEVTGVVITLIDINALKRSRAHVKRLSAIVENSSDAIVGMDLSGTILAWNYGAVMLYGCDASESVGRNMTDFVPEAYREEFADCLSSIEAGKASGPVDTVRRRRDGSTVEVAVTFSPVKDEHGRIVGASAIARDVSKRKRAERSARRAIRQRDQFTAMISHELRNPLMGLLTASESMVTAQLDEGNRRAADVISRQSKHMARLLDDLLDVSRVWRDAIELRRDEHDLRGAIVAALETARNLADAAKVELDEQLAEEPLIANIDPTRIQQAVANLLGNAIKFTPAGRRVWIRVTKSSENEAVLTVKDEGQGIEAESLDEIFEPFRQAHGQQPPQGPQAATSLGLGLALVRSIVGAHGGSVVASSDGPGMGAEFVVRIPLVKRPRAKPQPVPESKIELKSGLRVVLVEDEADNRELLELRLRKEGVDVRAAACGADALALFEENSGVDLAIIDIGLPDMSGLDVAREIRGRFSENGLVLVALTGHGRQRDREAVEAAGFDEHLVKPVSFSVLRSVIARHTAH